VVTMKEIQAIGRRIGREFHPQRVILFGSHAHGRARPDSDIDILVILPFRGQGFRKSLEILNRLDLSIPIDLLARQPGDVKRRYAERDPIIRDALDRGKVLYEQHR
jgi:predicted nucleotidyltransferase